MSRLPDLFNNNTPSTSPTPESPTLSAHLSHLSEDSVEPSLSTTIYLSLPNSSSSSIATMTSRSPDVASQGVTTITKSSNDSGSVSSIPRLGDDNYSSWLMSIKDYLTMKDLDGIIDGTESSPLEPLFYTVIKNDVNKLLE